MASKPKKPKPPKKPEKDATAEQVMAHIRTTWGLSNKIAKAIGISRMAVYQWPVVPVDRIHDVADVTRWKPGQIRPDIFRRSR